MTTSASRPDDKPPWWSTAGEAGDLPMQELRIAASFSGGVSLAIWMSGLTYELDRLLRSSDAERSERCAHAERELEEPDNCLQPGQTQRSGTSEQSSPSRPTGKPQPSERVEPADSRYAALLRLLRIDMDVDVVTGTSAGGINGVALALARTCGSSLQPLRGIWLEVGSFSELLRPVDEPKPLSVLRGDGVMLNGLDKGLQTIVDQADDVSGAGRRTSTDSDGELFPSRANQLCLLVTATMTTPDITTVRDSLGTAIPMADNQALFRFSQPAGKRWDSSGFPVKELAKAARSSASYPAAFEPSFVRIGGDGAGEGPDMKAHLGIRSSRWMIDGGLRNNEPVGQALRAVWEQPAGRRTRRVMLHVSPDPGAPTSQAAKLDNPLNLVQSLGATVSAPFVQSWRADLEAARRQSLGANRRRVGTDAVHGLVSTGDEAWALLAGLLRTTRSEWVADDFVAALDKQLGRFASADNGPTAGTSAFTSAAFDELRSTTRNLARGYWAGGQDGQGSLARGGRTSLEPDSRTLAHFGPDLFNATLDVLLRSLREQERGEGGGDSPDGPIPTAAETLHESRVAGEKNVLFEGDLLVAFLQKRLQNQGAIGAENFNDWATGLFKQWLWAAFPRPDDGVGLGEVADWVGFPPPEVGANLLDSAANLRASWEQLLASTSIVNDHLVGSTAGPAVDVLGIAAGSSRARVAIVRGATELLTLGDGRLADQEFELVQMSAQTRTLLSPLSQPADKLLGTRMGHFGAFVRRSWRANDWMWGRLDGVGWLMHLLLTPERLQEVAKSLTVESASDQDRVAALLRELRRIACVDAAGNSVPELEEQWDVHIAREWGGSGSRTASQEIEAAIEDPGSIEALPNLSLAMAYGMQRDVAAVELPEIASQMRLTEAGKSSASREVDKAFIDEVDTNSRACGEADELAWIDKGFTDYVYASTGSRAVVMDPAAVSGALAKYKIQDETDAGDLLADPALRTLAADSVAVATAALHTATPEGVPVLPTVTGTARKATRGVSHTLRSNSPAGWVSFGLIGIGVLFLLLDRPVLTALGLPLLVTGVVSLTLVGFRRVWLAIGGFVLSFVAAGLAVWSLSAHDPDRWQLVVDERLLPIEDWLNSHGILVVGGVVLIVGLLVTGAVVLLVGWVGRWSSRRS